MKKYTVYALINPKTKSPFYVGLTTQLNWRVTTHRSATHTEVTKTIKRLGGHFMVRILEIVVDRPGKNRKQPLPARLAEQYWINEMIRQGYNLVNKRTRTVNV